MPPLPPVNACQIQDTDPTVCHRWRKDDECHAMNPWLEFLAYHGGPGAGTMRERADRYHAMKAARGNVVGPPYNVKWVGVLGNDGKERLAHDQKERTCTFTRARQDLHSSEQARSHDLNVSPYVRPGYPLVTPPSTPSAASSSHRTAAAAAAARRSRSSSSHRAAAAAASPSRRSSSSHRAAAVPAAAAAAAAASPSRRSSSHRTQAENAVAASPSHQNASPAAKALEPPAEAGPSNWHEAVAVAPAAKQALKSKSKSSSSSPNDADARSRALEKLIKTIRDLHGERKAFRTKPLPYRPNSDAWDKYVEPTRSLSATPIVPPNQRRRQRKERKKRLEDIKTARKYLHQKVYSVVKMARAEGERNLSVDVDGVRMYVVPIKQLLQKNITVEELCDAVLALHLHCKMKLGEDFLKGTITELTKAENLDDGALCVLLADKLTIHGVDVHSSMALGHVLVSVYAYNDWVDKHIMDNGSGPHVLMVDALMQPQNSNQVMRDNMTHDADLKEELYSENDGQYVSDKRVLEIDLLCSGVKGGGVMLMNSLKAAGADGACKWIERHVGGNDDAIEAIVLHSVTDAYSFYAQNGFVLSANGFDIYPLAQINVNKIKPGGDDDESRYVTWEKRKKYYYLHRIVDFQRWKQRLVHLNPPPLDKIIEPIAPGSAKKALLYAMFFRLK